MKQVCVLGNGQLGRMLRQAGEPLGIAVWPVGLDAEPAAVPFQQSVITAEIERWPETALTRELARHPAFVNRDVFPIIADRLTQKQLFDKLHLPTAPWQLLADRSEWPAGKRRWCAKYRPDAGYASADKTRCCHQRRARQPATLHQRSLCPARQYIRRSIQPVTVRFHRRVNAIDRVRHSHQCDA